jgi:hypothetical protein
MEVTKWRYVNPMFALHDAYEIDQLDDFLKLQINRILTM